jgi:AraC-like DNA-binding protein
MTTGTTLRESVRGVPASPVRSVVSGYHGYLDRGVPPALHRGLPSPYLTVIFTLHEPLQVAQHVDQRRPPGEYDSLVGGLHTSPALVTHDGAQSGIQLRLSPLGARALLGMPAGELAGVDVAGSAVLGRAAYRIGEVLRDAATWPERFAALDRQLLAQGAQAGEAARQPAPEVVEAWRCLLRTGGTVPISRLAAHVGWSDRQLARRFRTEIGLTPKAAARVIRFDRARRLLQRGATGSLAQLAADCGYYDQPHLVREFNAFAGCPPTQWYAEEFGNIQAVPQSDEPRSGHD